MELRCQMGVLKTNRTKLFFNRYLASSEIASDKSSKIYTDVNNPQRTQVCSEDFKRGNSQTDSEIFTSKAQLTFTN